MNKGDFRQFFHYSDNCWSLLGEILATGSPAAKGWETPFETTSQWNTIRLLLAHSIAAEERLITLRLQQQPLPVAYEERAASEWEDLYRDHQSIRAATYAYLEALTDAEVEEPKQVWRIAGGGLTRGDVLLHILNHENYHRGQVVMALQRMGFDPPNFDYILLKASRDET